MPKRVTTWGNEDKTDQVSQAHVRYVRNKCGRVKLGDEWRPHKMS